MAGIILIGAGGHCKACIDVLMGQGVYGITALVDKETELGAIISGYTINYTDKDLPGLIKEHKNVLITVGQIKTPAIRIKLYEAALNLGATFPSHISHLAYVSPSASIGQGTIIMHQALVNAGAVVGDNCIINSKSLLEHDVQVGSHCHISTGVLLNGEVVVGEGSFVGSGAIIGQQVKVGENTTIGAGAVVLKDVPAGSLVKGFWV